MTRLNLLLLAILCCVCPSPFEFDTNANKIRIRINVETSNTHPNVANIPSDTMCAVINSGFPNEPMSADVHLPICPRAETRYKIVAKKRDIRSNSSLVVFKRLLYEIVAAALSRHTTTMLPKRATSHKTQRPPKRIKKRWPGLKRNRWRDMSLAFSKNALLHIFYRSNRNSYSIAHFLGLIGCALRAAAVCYVVNTIILARYSFAISVFWTRYTVISTRYYFHCFWHNKIIQFRRMQLQWRLFLLLARTISISFAIQVIIFDVRSETESSCSRNHRTRSKNTSKTPWKRILYLLILFSHPLYVAEPNNDRSVPWGESSVINIATTRIKYVVTSRIGAIIAAISASWCVYWRFPSLKQAQAHLKDICIDDCYDGAKHTHSLPPPSSRVRPKNSRGMSSRLLQMLIILSLPTLVTAPNSKSVASSFQASATVAVVGLGAAAAASRVVYDPHRTRKWTEKEIELESQCTSCGVEYLTPPRHETEQQQAVRRKSMVKECGRIRKNRSTRIKKNRSRINAEEELKKLCCENDVSYIPPPPDESTNQQRNRRRNLRRACNDELRSNMAIEMKRRRKAGTPQQQAARLCEDASRKREGRENETPQQKKRRQHKDNERRKRMNEATKANKKVENYAYCEDDDIFINGEVPYIEVNLDGANKARELLLRTRTRNGDSCNCDDCHRAIGCSVCDQFIIGTEELCWITKEELLKHKDRLGVEAYQEYYHGGQEIDQELKQQYEISGMEGMLLSRRFGKDDASEFMICSSCKASLRTKSESPPKYSIANGFLIGTIPTTIAFEQDGEMKSLKTIKEVHDEHGKPIPNQTVSLVTSVMAAAISPTRPYAYIFSYRGGRHQSLIGNFQFFETDQAKIAGALKCLHQSGVASNIYVVLNGKMTPTQKDIIRKKAELDTRLYFGLLCWFKEHHPAFRDLVIEDESSAVKIELVEDPDSDSNTDISGDPTKENKEEGATFYFSGGGEPTTDTSVYKTSRELVMAILKDHSAPTLAIHGGNYASHLDVMKLESVFPTVFPFGSGGPTLERRNKISDEEIIRHYLKLSLPQFMESEFVLVANFLLGRILSFKSAVMKCRPLVNEHGEAVGDEIGKMTIEEIEEAINEEQANKKSNSTASKFLRAVSASCRHLGMNEEAAKSARRKCFALQDFFGMHSLFVTITIDDECSFRVRLYPYADANGEGVSLLCNVTCSGRLMLLGQTLISFFFVGRVSDIDVTASTGLVRWRQ